MATPTQVFNFCTEFIYNYVSSAGLAGATVETIRNYLTNQGSPTHSIVYPAYARGIGYVYITDSSPQGYHVTDGTIYLPGGVNPSESITIFSAGDGLYSVEVTGTNSYDMLLSKRNDGSYYYRFHSPDSDARIHSYWSGTEYLSNLTGVYIGAGSYPVQQYPSALSGQVMCKLKYWTYNSYKSNVDNSGGTDVPTDYTVFVNIPVGGDTINYNEYCTEIVNQYNISYPQETITPEDLPDWQEIIDYVYPPTTEPTEPPTEPPTSPIYNIDIDYNRIVSPTDLDNALNAEQYTDIQLDTGILSLDNSVQIPTETFDNNFLLVIPSAVQSGKTLFSTLGIWNIFLPCAVLLAVFAVFKR